MQRIIHNYLRLNPKLISLLKQAKLKIRPEEFIKKAIIFSLYVSLTFTILSFFLFDTFSIPLIMLLPVFIIAYLMSFSFLLNSPRVTIRKRQREINQEVLFAGRYLLVKLDSGVPLYNALIDASNSYGISSKYFKEIVDDIKLGIPIEEALESTRESCPSDHFKIILTELITSLKTGVDVTVALRDVLQQIMKEQILEIKEYGKKMNAFMMLYMVLATVMPSLGVTMFIILAGLTGIPLSNGVMLIILLIMAFTQFMFLGVLKSLRPMVNI
jgi:pilus assembly protein TadC